MNPAVTDLWNRLAMEGRVSRPVGEAAERPAGPVKLLLPEGLRPSWLPGGETLLPPLPPTTTVEGSGEVLAEIESNGRRRPAALLHEGTLRLAFDPLETLRTLLEERYVDLRAPLHERLPFPVPTALVPGRVRLLIHGLLERKEPAEDSQPFPRWPEEPAAEALVYLMSRLIEKVQGEAPPPFLPWPGGECALSLTHDVDTEKGLAGALRLAELEARRGWRAAYYVVGRILKKRPAEARALREMGHEVGLHGARHDLGLGARSERELERALEPFRPLVEDLELRGFRAPGLFASAALYRVLGRLGFEYDSSAPDVDLRSLLAPRRGCCAVHPFFRGSLAVLPAALSTDDRLELLGVRGPEALDFWLEKLAFVRRLGGAALVLTHTEPHLTGGRLFGNYELLLERLEAEERLWRATPREAATAYREAARRT